MTDVAGLGVSKADGLVYRHNEIEHGGDSICFRTTECTPDGAGLTYVRDEDTHGYVVRHDQMIVQPSHR
ncbi:hypothetical protein ACIBHX_07770 [Nonomuraea sp. NPDC050536]|uniref:hypothetical protein n=1 Tax=Nonomuraea sp. NPDC050536 TaxID=3364366 RepID=UPI0037C86A96